MTYSSKLKRRPARATSSRSPRSSNRSTVVLLALMLLLALAAGWQWLQSRGAAQEDTATLSVLAGKATVTRSGGRADAPLEAGQTTRLQRGDALVTTADASAKLTLSGGETIELAGRTHLGILQLYRAAATRAQVAVLALHEGKTLSRIRHGLFEGMRFEIEMNTATVKARGTVFQCDALANDHAWVSVYDGVVEISMGEQVVDLEAGQGLDVWLGQPLEPVETGQAIPGGPPEATALPANTATMTDREKTAFPPVSTPTRPGDVVATPASGRTVTPGEGVLYTVQSGDTLYSIARKFGVSWEDVWNANKDILAKPEFVRAGQELRIPISQ